MLDDKMLRRAIVFSDLFSVIVLQSVLLLHPSTASQNDYRFFALFVELWRRRGPSTSSSSRCSAAHHAARFELELPGSLLPINELPATKQWRGAALPYYVSSCLIGRFQSGTVDPTWNRHGSTPLRWCLIRTYDPSIVTGSPSFAGGSSMVPGNCEAMDHLCVHDLVCKLHLSS